MKNCLWILLCLVLAFASTAQQQPSVTGTISTLSNSNGLPAFPGAEGFGRYASGGRGGTVYRVTTLEDGDEPGTFRHAVAQKGVRTIVFDVAGTIFLNSRLNIVNGDLTIAGQTAPGQGVCIARHQVSVNANNVIIRYLRFRVGNEGGGEPDGLGGSRNKNVIIDHCSISWSVDETCTFYGGENVTVQWCLISESLRTAGHAKGKHGFGAIVGGHRSSFHHNLMAHHESRVPRLGPHVSTQEREYVDMRNNVFYNWAGGGCYGGEGMHVNIVNNYYKPGPATPENSRVRYRIVAIGVRTSEYVTGKNGQPNAWKPMEHVWGRFYVDGNLVEGYEDVTRDNWPKGVYEQVDRRNDNTFTEAVKKEIRLGKPLNTDVVTTHTAEEAYHLVLKYAGSSKQRDIIDARIVEETQNGTAASFGSISSDAKNYPGLIDVPDDVKPIGATSAWPNLAPGKLNPELLIDADGDGMSDWWEMKNGLDPNNASDGKAVTLCKAGYTNLEVYLNGLVDEITERQNVIDHTLEAPQLAFPGAEGFGAYAKGGRGGKVLYVTNLNHDGVGSLRWAVEQEGPRTVVFAVSGNIDLQKRITISNPGITIAGQTAPGDGICVRGETIVVAADDVVIRYLRVRLGDSKNGIGSKQGKDAISISKGKNIIIDHCSTSWSLDENLSASASHPTLNNVTVQWCFITEALNPENHGFGSLIRGTGGAKYSFLYNLYANNWGRNPRPGNYNSNPYTKDPEGLLLDFRNNLIYNWGGSHAGYNADNVSVTRLNYVGNYLLPGPDSEPNGKAYATGSPYNKSYFAGNYYGGKRTQDQWELVKFNNAWTNEQMEGYKQSKPFETGTVNTMDAVEAYREILESGGAALPKRDTVDKRIVKDVRSRKGKIINSQQEVGGWPELKSRKARKDTDQDGMPDYWEDKNNLDKFNPDDRNKVAADGYTMLEKYLNSIK